MRKLVVNLAKQYLRGICDRVTCAKKRKCPLRGKTVLEQGHDSNNF